MKRAATIGRVDLLMALIAVDREGPVPHELLGFERLAVEVRDKDGDFSRRGFRSRQDPAPPPPAAPPALDVPLPQFGERRLEFLVPTHQLVLQPQVDDPRPAVEPLSDAELAVPVRPVEPGPPLAPWSRLAPFLRRALGVTFPSRRLDHVKLGRLLGRGLPLLELPRLPRLRWSNMACIVWDTSAETEPFVPDAAELVRRLKRERGRTGLHVMQSHGPLNRSATLPAGVPVVVMSAMGQLSGDIFVQRTWRSLGQRLAAAGHRLTGLVPCSPAGWSGRVNEAWPLAAWDRWARPRLAVGPSATDDQTRPVHPATERLLDLLSVATLVTPRLLRRVRLLLGPDVDASAEHDAWFHPDTTGSESIRYFNFRPGESYEERLSRRQRLRADAAGDELVAEVDSLIASDHRQWFSPAIAAEAEARALLAGGEAGASAEVLRAWLERCVERLRALATNPCSPSGHECGLAGWFVDFVGFRLASAMRRDRRIADLVARGLTLARQFLQSTDAPWPAMIDLEAAGQELRRLRRRRGVPWPLMHHVFLDGDSLVVTPRGRLPHSPRLNPLSDLLSGDRILQVTDGTDSTALHQMTDDMRAVSHPVKSGCPITLTSDLHALRFSWLRRPSWASRMWLENGLPVAEAMLDGTAYRFAWKPMVYSISEPHYGGGLVWLWTAENKPAWAESLQVDEFGLFADFSIDGVSFIMRWIPPGRFLMGSPEDEPGRSDYEGPQHEVTLTLGYWLGETPVTQAQWRVVVERVTANRTMFEKFMRRKGELLAHPSYFKGESGQLPVEQIDWLQASLFTQWLGTLLVEGRSQSPTFRLPTEAEWEYACRAGTTSAFNDGSPCTIPGGKDPAVDALGWSDANSGRRTHPVKGKQPNAWGLHDMHGNVCEWCADGFAPYAAEPSADRFIPPRGEAWRVVRGGSWDLVARFCRSACRLGSQPSDPWSYLGLRLAAGQELRGAEPHVQSTSGGLAKRSRRGVQISSQ